MADLLEMYKSGMSTRDIAAKTGSSPMTVQRKLKALGYTPRPKLEAAIIGKRKTRDEKSRTMTPEIVQQALGLLHARMLTTPFLTASEDSKNYFQLRLAPHEREVFCVAFITSQNQLIACEDMFQGTLDGSSVYPREVVKRALHHNAAACVFAHNHPSGLTTPSRSDETITKRLQEALALVDVRVLDHIVVSHAGTTSFAEQGLI